MNFNQEIQTETKSFLIKQSLDVRQLGKSRQDHAAQGTYTEEGITTRWLAVWDGHGDNHAIDYVRKAPLDEIMKSKTPAETLHQAIIKDKTLAYTSRLKSGTTMIWAKETEFSDHREIEIGNVGDSQAVLFINNECVFISKRHDMSNPTELVRLFSQGRLNKAKPLIQKATTFETISDNTLIQIKGSYFIFENKNKYICELAGSQSLGHEDITGVYPETTYFSLNLTDSFSIVLCSDGITDVMPLEGLAMDSTLDTFYCASGPNELLDEAERRWKQVWTVLNENDRTIMIQDSFPEDGYDDCACAFIKGIPLLSDYDEQGELLIFDKPLIQTSPPPPEKEKSSESMESMLRFAMGIMPTDSSQDHPTTSVMMG